MKDSKDEEHRISNLKNMIENMREGEKEKKYIEEEMEYDEELINYLHEDKKDEEEIEIDDEFIYNPEKDDAYASNLEEDAKIDESYIIETDINDAELDSDKDKSDDESSEDTDIIKDEELEEPISEHFDNIVHARVGEIPIFAVLALVIGIIAVAYSVYLMTFSTDRIIDNVISGELNTAIVILAIFGILLIIIGIFKLLSLRNPFENLSKSIDNIEKPISHSLKKEDSKPTEEEEPITPVKKVETPIDRENYKIGEFDINSFKEKLNKPTSKLDGVEHTQEKKTKQATLDDVPQAKEKPVEEESEKVETETEEKNNHQEEDIDNETIDDIFADIEEIDEIPIVSVDTGSSKDENSSKKEE